MGADKLTKRLPAIFFTQKSGSEPVRDWLLSLSEDDGRIVGHDLRDLEFSWPIGLPLCKSLGHGLWEVRSALSHGKIGRVIFCNYAGAAILLHSFIKKTQKIPKRDMDLALKRMRDVMQ